MATEYYYLEGKAKWCKLFKLDEKYKNWQMQLYPTPESLQIYDDSGMTMQKKTDEDGTFITFRRPEAKVIKDELVKFNPPTLLDTDGNPLDQLVGNGSDVTIKVIVYDTIKGKGHRLEAVKVNKLIPYVKQDPMSSGPVAASATAGAKSALAAIPF